MIDRSIHGLRDTHSTRRPHSGPGTSVWLGGIVLLALASLAVSGCSGGPSNTSDTGLIVVDEDGGSTDGGGGSTDCGEGMTFCDGRCVDTGSSAEHCGSCGNSCESGATCMEGSCTKQPEDCREEPCKGLTYCDLNTGKCKPGCSSDDQCSSNETCKTAAHECVCVSGTKRFKGACVNESQCNEQFCSGSQYCDLGAGKCRSGCYKDGQCGSGETCDTSSNECVCTSGRSRFDGECVNEQECNQQFCAGDQYCDLQAGTCRSGCHQDSQCGDNEVCGSNNTCVCDSQTQRFKGECLDTQSCNQKFCGEYEYCDFSSSSCRTGCYTNSQCGSNGRCNTGSHECSCNAGYFKSGYGCLAESSTVDSSNKVGGDLSLDVDDSGHVHIAYDDTANENLKYAVWNGRKWKKKSFSSSNDRGKDVSIAVDASGDPHISYYDDNDDSPIYTTKSGGGWTTETVDKDSGTGKSTAIAVDGSDPHIVHLDWGDEKYKYAEKGFGSDWDQETVGKSIDVRGGGTAIAVDSSGDPAIAYTHSQPRSGSNSFETGVSFADGSGFDWSNELIASDVQDKATALVFDSNDKAQVAYIDRNDAYHAEKSGGSWQTTHIGGTGSDENISIALDGRDRPHVVYRGRYDLKHAWWNGSSWKVEEVNKVSRSAGDNPSLDIYNGRAYIAHQHDETQNVKLRIMDL